MKHTGACTALVVDPTEGSSSSNLALFEVSFDCRFGRMSTAPKAVVNVLQIDSRLCEIVLCSHKVFVKMKATSLESKVFECI